jgi:DNA-directed RNA polymerase
MPLKYRDKLGSFEELGAALGHDRAKPPLIDRKLDEVSRTKQRFDRQSRDRPFTATVEGRALFARYDILPKLAGYIESTMARDAPPDAPKPPRELRRLIRLVDFETLALVAVDSLINRIVAGWDWHDESCAMKVALSVGRDLRDEIEMARLLDPDKFDYRRVMEADNRHRALSPYRTLEWSNEVTVRAGWWLLNCAEECDLFESEQRQIGRNVLTLPKIADGYWAIIEELRKELSPARPYYLPHLEQPPDWTSFRTEYGADRMPATFVRDEHPDTVAAVQAAFEISQIDRTPATFVRSEHPDHVAAVQAAVQSGQNTAQIEPHANGVSNVQRVPWMINEFMVPVVEKLAERVEKRFKTASDDDAERFRIALHADIDLTRQLIGQPFWTPYHVDFRGRLNPLPHFNIGREDRVRCLFQFWNGQPVGDSAHWIEIAVANAAGEKGKWSDRHDWVSKHIDLIRRVAEDPIGTVEEWEDFSDPFQFVAACRELVEAQKDPNFITRLPIFLDGTSNGLQHLACMTCDEKSGKFVNLINLSERYDIYGVVFANVKARLQATDDKLAAWWLSPGRLFRGLFKAPVMTFSYGVTAEGVRKQIIDAYKKEFGLHEPHFWHVNYLANLITKATKEELRRPHIVMEFIRKLAELQGQKNLPLKWVTPSGLPVSNNRCYEPNTKRVELKLKGRRVRYSVADGRKDEINVADAINDAPPNFVHSMDAAHLVLSVNAVVEEGITDIAVIHDCYAALAPQVQRFQQIIRRELALMYHIDVLRRLRDGCDGASVSEQLPEKGNLDLLEIQTAEYPFT